MSALLHFAGAAIVLVAAPAFLRRVGTTPLLKAGAVVHVFTLAFLLTFSALFHFSAFALSVESPATQGFRRLDHIGIWIVIGGFFTLPHLIGFRGGWRWVPLAIVWSAAGAGLIFKVFFFGRLSLAYNVALYAAASAVGVASVIRFAGVHGLGTIRWALGCYGAYIAGAYFLLFTPPDLVEGVFGPHEVWHVGVLLGTWCHWRFVLHLTERGATPTREATSARRSEQVAP